MQEAGGHLRSTRGAAIKLLNLVHAPENLKGLTFKIEERVLHEGPVLQAIRGFLGVYQNVHTPRLQDSGLFDQLVASQNQPAVDVAGELTAGPDAEAEHHLPAITVEVSQ